VEKLEGARALFHRTSGSQLLAMSQTLLEWAINRQCTRDQLEIKPMSTGKYQKRNGFRSDLSDILENGEMVEAPGF